MEGIYPYRDRGGLNIDDFAPRLSFFWGIGMNFYMEIAKMRAARLLWAEIVGEFSPSNPKSSMLRHTARRPVGPDRAGSLQQHCANNYRGDGRRIWRYAKPSHECSRRGDCVTLRFRGKNRTQYAVGPSRRTGISQVVDPWGGSYMMESLTNEIAEKPERLSQR